MTVYELKNVERTLGDFHLSVDHCCLERGEVYAIAGPNGCGKTALLDVLALLVRPSRGAVSFRGRAVDHGDQKALLAARRRVGYLMQNPYLFNMSVLSNVTYGLRVRGASREEAGVKAERTMARLSLLPYAGRGAHALSGGEAQRVALARTFVLEPDVLLLDEPTANVDQKHVHAVEAMILAANRERGATVVVTTHSREQAYRLSQHQISIVNGRICDIAYENVFSGTLVEETEGLRALHVGGVTVRLASGRPGDVTVAIDPQGVLLSDAPLSSSAQNAFLGPISRVEEVNGSLRIFVDIGVPLCALVTKKSFADMGLNVGKRIWVTFKANAVKVL